MIIVCRYLLEIMLNENTSTRYLQTLSNSTFSNTSPLGEIHHSLRRCLYIVNSTKDRSNNSWLSKTTPVCNSPES